jgi:hypothetical protein
VSAPLISEPTLPLGAPSHQALDGAAASLARTEQRGKRRTQLRLSLPRTRRLPRVAALGQTDSTFAVPPLRALSFEKAIDHFHEGLRVEKRAVKLPLTGRSHPVDPARRGGVARRLPRGHDQASFLELTKRAVDLAGWEGEPKVSKTLFEGGSRALELRCAAPGQR